jgi:hypothetical protein
VARGSVDELRQGVGQAVFFHWQAEVSQPEAPTISFQSIETYRARQVAG